MLRLCTVDGFANAVCAVENFFVAAHASSLSGVVIAVDIEGRGFVLLRDTAAEEPAAGSHCVEGIRASRGSLYDRGSTALD